MLVLKVVVSALAAVPAPFSFRQRLPRCTVWRRARRKPIGLRLQRSTGRCCNLRRRPGSSSTRRRRWRRSPARGSSGSTVCSAAASCRTSIASTRCRPNCCCGRVNPPRPGRPGRSHCGGGRTAPNGGFSRSACATSGPRCCVRAKSTLSNERARGRAPSTLTATFRSRALA